MKGFLLPLTGIMLCAATLHSAAADPAVPLQTKHGEELRAAVTDMPDIFDMSYADPKTWLSLPPAAQVFDHSRSYMLPSEEAEFLKSIRLWH
ncbi:MAG: hypothetical protein ACREDO_02605 [Methyloceanibacter sp.]